jgi:hypothetical protein
VAIVSNRAASVQADRLVDLPDEHLETLEGRAFTEYSTLAQYRTWDDWPFLLVFIAVLSAAWWLGKRTG